MGRRRHLALALLCLPAPAQCELPRMPIPRTPVNRDKRRYLIACASMQEFGIGDVIAAFIGAIFGATANGWVSSWRDQRRRNDELRGLLNLIRSEMHYNASVLAGFAKDSEAPPEQFEKAILKFRTDTWDQVSERLAQLLSSEELSLLVHYYGVIRTMQIAPSQVPSMDLESIRSYRGTVDYLISKHRLA
jgi:hypothetical protein